MCGICGFTGEINRPLLERMANTIRHRGPDDSGYWSNDSVSLGMRRLSIVDIENGHQPIYNEDKSVVCIFNGEIYNHIELRRELESLGHTFYTDHSDTEVLVHLYEEYGGDFSKHLNGMFAIALWDKNKEELHLIRDRVGVKPLYYSIQNSELIFASEIKSIFQHSKVRREPDYSALSHYFSLKNIPAPQTAFNGISQVRPGERLVFSHGKLEKFQWWKINFSAINNDDEEYAKIHIRKLLESSVRIRMKSDAPFGAYLSGGLDSSAVVALMANMSDQPIKTFSLTYEKDYMYKSSDRDFARQISKKYRTEHYEYMMTHSDLIDSMDAVQDAFDEPYSGVTSTYFITNLISKHVKVALSGDGADELFGSYLPHRLASPLYYYSKYKNRLNSLNKQEIEQLAPFEKDIGYLSDLYSKGSESERRMELYLFNDKTKHDKLFSKKMRYLIKNSLSTHDLVLNSFNKSATNDPLNRALSLDFETLLPDQVLMFVDRLSMAHSVEVRTPFLDYRLVEYVASLPGNYKIKNGRVKSILKDSVSDLLPKEILNRPKEGFVLPINDWIIENLSEYISEILDSSRLKKHGLLNHEFVASLLDNHFKGLQKNGPQLWNLVMFQLWWEHNFS
jgi:asparagine synthase (glutamine-hydrolysing)